MSDIATDLDVDVCHFSELYPNLDSDSQSLYYDVDKLDSFDHKSSNFSVLHLNIRSLLSKIDELSSLLSILEYRFDLIPICETWLSSPTQSLVHMSGYKFYGESRGDRRGGGVGVFVRESIPKV